MKHVLNAKQYDRESLEKLFELTDDIQKNPIKYSKKLDGKIVAVMFYEPSKKEPGRMPSFSLQILQEKKGKHCKIQLKFCKVMQTQL